MNNDNDIFLKQMIGVSPLKKNNRIKKEVEKNKHTFVKKNKPNQTLEKRRVCAVVCVCVCFVVWPHKHRCRSMSQHE